MVRVLLDACVPHWLRHELSEFDVTTAHYARLDQIPDNELLEAGEGRFDVLVTLDRKMVLEHKIAGRQISVVVIRLEQQIPSAMRAVIPALKSALMTCKAGQVLIVGPWNSGV